MPVGAPYGRSQRRYNTNLSQCIGDIKEGVRVLAGTHVSSVFPRVINGLDIVTINPFLEFYWAI